MSTIVTRSGKGSPLSHVEVDANFTNLDTDKVEKTAAAITGGTINGTTVGATTPAAGTFTTITGQTEVLKGTGTNLLTYSQPLNTGWIKLGTATLTENNATAPDGTSTAALISCPAGGDYIYQIPATVVGSLYTFSYYIKNSTATTSFAQIRTNTTALSVSIAWSAGVPTPSIITGTGTVSATSVGSGWYRLVMSYTCSEASARHRIYGGDGTSVAGNILVWGVQLEFGSIANTYIPTTTTAIYGTPTLSFSGVAGLGLESNGSLYVSPAGTGALQAQATTSSTVGGNARGANAVDWQTSRAGATQVASSSFSTIGGGANNTASTSNGTTIAGGRNNTSSAQDSFVGGGNSNTASGLFSSSVGGLGNIASGYYGFVGNGNLNSTTSNSAVTTQSGTMNATTAVTLSGSNASIKVGQLITGTSISTTPNTYVAAISGTSLTLSQAASGSSTSTLSFFTPHGVVVGGGNNQATGSYSFIGGGGDAGTAANRNVASGDWSVVAGGRINTASATGSVVCGGGFDNTNLQANTASGVASFVGGGINNSATAIYTSVSGGRGNSANATSASVIGSYGTSRSIVGNTVLSANYTPLGTFAVGNSQSAVLVLARQTTDATATALASDGNAASGTNQVILPNNSAYFFTGEVVSGKTAGGDSKGWTIEGVIKRGANAAATTLVGSTVTSLYADAGAATWAIAVTADTTNGGIRVTFTGQASTTIRTVCQIRTTEMTY